VKGRDLALTIGGVIFLVVAIPMTIVEGWVGVATLVLSLAILAVPVSSRIGGPGGPRRITVHGEPAVVIDARRATVWMGRFAIAAFAAVGAIMIVVGDVLLGIVVAGFFSFVLVWSFVATRGRFRLLVTRAGLEWGSHRAGWEELAQAKPAVVSSTPLLVIPGAKIALESFPVDPEALAAALRAAASEPERFDEVITSRLDLGSTMRPA
jgi:hypothetical protein